MKIKYLRGYQPSNLSKQEETEDEVAQMKEDVEFIQEHTNNYFLEDRIIEEINNCHFDRNEALDNLLNIKEMEEKKKRSQELQKSFKKSQSSRKQQNIVVLNKTGETITTPNKGKISKHNQNHLKNEQSINNTLLLDSDEFDQFGRNEKTKTIKQPKLSLGRGKKIKKISTNSFLQQNEKEIENEEEQENVPLNLKKIEIFKNETQDVLSKNVSSEFGQCLTESVEEDEHKKNSQFILNFLNKNPVKLTLPIDVTSFDFVGDSPDDIVLNTQKNQKLTKELENSPVIKKPKFVKKNKKVLNDFYKEQQQQKKQKMNHLF